MPEPLAETVAVSQAVVVEQVLVSRYPRRLWPQAACGKGSSTGPRSYRTTQIVEGDIDRKVILAIRRKRPEKMALL